MFIENTTLIIYVDYRLIISHKIFSLNNYPQPHFNVDMFLLFEIEKR